MTNPPWQERFDIEFAPERIWVVPSQENVQTIEDIKDLIAQELARERKEAESDFKKTLNSSKRMYEIGRQEALQEVEEMLKEVKGKWLEDDGEIIALSEALSKLQELRKK